MNLLDKILFKAFRVKTTYSQTGEDKILQHLFTSYNKDRISYLDIGTNHPIINNNTYSFYREGGSGVCVEPNPQLYSLIKKARKRDKVIQAGVSTGEEKVIDFYSMNVHTLSTFSKEEAEELDRGGKYRIEEVIKVPVKNVNNLVKDHFDRQVDLVSIDVEGWNEEIIRSFDFTSARPFCFCVETITFSEENDGKKIMGIFDIFNQNGYRVYADTYLNTIFVDAGIS